VAPAVVEQHMVEASAPVVPAVVEQHVPAASAPVAPAVVEQHMVEASAPVAPAVAEQHVPAASAAVAPENKGGGLPAQDFVVVQPELQERVSDKDPNQVLPEAQGSTPAQTATAPTSPEPQTTPVQRQPAVNFAAEQRQTPAPNKHEYTGEPISVNLKDVDLKDFFRLIHEISGLNIVLDPNVAGSLTLVLDDVPWDQALDIVLKNNALDRELEGNVLRIATIETLRNEAEGRRRQVEAQTLSVQKVTVTRFLSYARAKDVQPAIKRLLSVRGEIIADDRTNGLIISDIPNSIPLIDTLLTQLDRKTQEVEIEARVVAATRTFARDIGTQLGLGWGNGSTAVGGAQAVGTSPTQLGYANPPAYMTSPIVPLQSGTATSSTAASIPLFSNLGAAAATSGLSLMNFGHAYRIDAILTAAESRGLAKILSRPRVITQNNVQALVKQGERLPITTSGQLGGPPTTQYVEAVLRLTVTPQITAENTIFLNIDIENTTDAGSRINDNPVFLTQQATTQVLVTNGGTVVIGGVVQTNNSFNVDQVPLLGSIPYLGNLFKHRTVNTQTQELIFFITPHIIET
jgi:type IV pilus assembly protein PilQ